ncbi:Uncharacterised protein [Collinsella aerofaciens]|uniref:Uncharacterized protein n=2 Tax=Collinsella aerofaciens TaxID=74426 RepID=A0A5K1JCL0_9ACTN|nr:Uncharacterised protein [Collinsella aerofaciens]
MVLPLGGRDEGARGGAPFEQARAAALRVLTAPGLAGRAYLQGGLVPWVASGRDSGRPHGDADVSVRLGDMPAVRSWLASEGLCDPALDSLGLGCDEGRGDFGAHTIVDGVLVSFCPFLLEGNGLRQRNASLAATDGFDALLEAIVPGVAEGDLFEGRALPGGAVIGCATLESVRAAAYAAMRIECVAHGE